MNQLKPIIKKFARQLRISMTEHEQIIWRYLRRKQIYDVQFCRQKPLGAFIVDFYAPSIKLVIEIDGSQHFEEEHMEQDKYRDDYLREAGVTVLRFGNRQVSRELDSVLERIYEVVGELKRGKEDGGVD